MFRFFAAQLLPFLFRQPQVGDRYTMDEANPFKKPFCYTVKEVKDGWVLYSSGSFGDTDVIEVKTLLGLFRLVPPTE